MRSVAKRRVGLRNAAHDRDGRFCLPKGVKLLSDQKAIACFRTADGRVVHVQVWWQVEGGFVVAHSDDTPALTHCDPSLPPAVCVECCSCTDGDRRLARLRLSRKWREYTDYFR